MFGLNGGEGYWVSQYPIKMKKKVLLFLGVMFIIIFFIPVQRLILVNQENNEILKSFSIKNGDKFIVYFIHSVERTPWYEIYEIKNNSEIFLTETIFHSFGAGLPATTTHDFSIEQDGMHIKNYNQKMDPLIYRVGAVIADHKIVVNGEEFKLDGLTKPFTPILIKVDKVYLHEYLIKEVANIE